MEEVKNPLTIDEAANDLSLKTLDVATDIIQTEDVQELKDLTHLFNLQHTKKQVIRTLQYDRLLDSITAQMEERVTKRADQFSNKELLDYMNVFSTSLEKAQKQLSSVDETPLIQVNQQNNTVIVGEELSRDSRRKITSVVESILAKINAEKPLDSENNNVYNYDSEIIEDSESEDYSGAIIIEEENEE